MRRLIYIAVAVLICLAIGYTASLFQAPSINTWYTTLQKSPLSPPDAAFPVAWSIIYVCMGISIGLVWNKKAAIESGLGWIFTLQLILNFAWSFLFFYLRNPIGGFIEITILDAVVLFYLLTCYRINKIAALLFIPYLLWLALATYLNAYIVLYN